MNGVVNDKVDKSGTRNIATYSNIILILFVTSSFKFGVNELQGKENVL